MDFSPDLVKGSIVPIILNLLKERARYGYELVKLVDARSNGLLQWREGTLYPALHRLEAERLVHAHWEEVAAGPQAGRKRKYYAITRKGLAELERRAAEWRTFSSAVSAIVLEA